MAQEIKKLNIGAGPSKQDGWTSVDLLPSADIVWDLRNGLPMRKIKRNSIEEIKVENFFEHLPETHYMLEEVTTYEVINKKRQKRRKPQLVEVKSRIKLMQHCWESMKHGAILTIWGPHGQTEGFLGDPTHTWAMGMSSMDYFCVQQCPPNLDDMKLPFHERKTWHNDYIKGIEYEKGHAFKGQFRRISVQRMPALPGFIEYKLEAIKR